MRLATLAIALLAGCAQPEGVQRWAEATGAFSSTETVSISGRDLAAIDGMAAQEILTGI